MPPRRGALLKHWDEIEAAEKLAALEAQRARMTPLVRACSDGDLAAVRALLEGGANPNERDAGGNIPLGAAVEAKDGIRCLAELLKAGADPNAIAFGNKMPPLHHAFNSAGAVRLLLDAGADPIKCNDLGFDAGRWAEIQLQWGADPDAVRMVRDASERAYAGNMRRFRKEQEAAAVTTQRPVTVMRKLTLK